MAALKEVQQGQGDAAIAADLKERVCGLIDALTSADPAAQQDYADLLARASALWHRKQVMLGTKRETRDMVSEVVFHRLERAFATFRGGSDGRDGERCAEWLVGSLFAGRAIADFARALDQTMLETQEKQDFTFAGQTDFISIQEVLQLVSSGGYTGILGLEKADNRLDLFIRDGKVVLFDPHHITRRILPGPDNQSHREIPLEIMEQAEQIKASAEIPLLVGMYCLGFLREDELPDLLQNLGLEVFYEFLCETGTCNFFYRKLDEMPDFVAEYGYAMSVTPILLEGSKRVDEWNVLLEVFPDPDEAIQPMDGMLARLDGLDLGVHEIKLFASLNNGVSPRLLASSIGLPLFDVYQHLVRYARDGVLVPIGGSETLKDITFTLEETMERAFEALDANDDNLEQERALEDALGDPFAGDGGNESFLDVLARNDPGVHRQDS